MTTGREKNKKLEPGQVWMSFRESKRGPRATTTLLVGHIDDGFSWLVLRTNDRGRCFVHVPALNFIGDYLDEDDEEQVIVRVV